MVGDLHQANKTDRLKMKVLNLYAGIGGNRKLWENVEVVAVEWDLKIAQIYQDFFPDDEVIITDAHKFLLENFMKYDFIWSSPPCPTHSKIRWMSTFAPKNTRKAVYPDMKLYEEIVLLDSYFEGKWCVENVISYYTPLIKPQIIGRHYLWANFLIRNERVNGGSHLGSVEELTIRKSFDISSYLGIDKKTILRNCVEPEIGKLVLDCARGNTQKTLLEVLNETSDSSFNIPKMNPSLLRNKEYIHDMPPSDRRGALRSVAPDGFARAFKEANP